MSSGSTSAVLELPLLSGLFVFPGRWCLWYLLIFEVKTRSPGGQQSNENTFRPFFRILYIEREQTRIKRMVFEKNQALFYVLFFCIVLIHRFGTLTPGVYHSCLTQYWIYTVWLILLDHLELSCYFMTLMEFIWGVPGPHRVASLSRVAEHGSFSAVSHVY